MLEVEREVEMETKMKKLRTAMLFNIKMQVERMVNLGVVVKMEVAVEL